MYTRTNLTFDEYQANVLRTANTKIDWHETVDNCLLGLFGELAEVSKELNGNSAIINKLSQIGNAAELLKKNKYHDKSTSLFSQLDQDESKLVSDSLSKPTFTPTINSHDNLKKELGDVTYYLFWLIDTLGFDATDVAVANIEKLRKRYVTGFSVEASLNRKD